MKNVARFLTGVLFVAATTMAASAQAPAHLGKYGSFTASPYNLALTYTAGHASGFWMQGGDFNVSARLWRGLAATGDVTGLHAGDTGDGVPVNLILVTFGPKASWRLHRPVRHPLHVFGESLFGTANGFSGLYPQAGAATSAAGSFALNLGGGVDYPLNHNFSVRLVQANWLRTQLPNAGNNVQNMLLLSAGVVWHIR